jgi:alpha-tubulin suppressor-like RCC1 family protein
MFHVHTDCTDKSTLTRLAGIGTIASALQPQLIELLCGRELTSMAFGCGPHVLALTATGEVFAWGHNSYGQLGLHAQTTCTRAQAQAAVTQMPVCRRCLSAVYLLAAESYKWLAAITTV